MAFCAPACVMSAMYITAFNQYSFIYDSVAMTNSTVRVDLSSQISEFFYRYNAKIDGIDCTSSTAAR